MEQSSASYFRTNLIVFIGLCTGQLFFLGISLFLVQTQAFGNQAKELDAIFQIVVPVFILLSVAASFFIFKMKLSKAIGQTDLPAKMQLYKSALIIRYALVEAAVMFCIIVHLLTGHQIYAIMAGVLWVYFIFLYPSKEKAKVDLVMDYQDQLKLDDPEAIITELNSRKPND